ncbi:hypothetical protein VTL71DRAFT_7650, partial [Oculimacula yallundae]
MPIVSGGAGRPSTACRQCRIQKLRCSGDLPSCNRCVRLHRLCQYPDHSVSDTSPGLTVPFAAPSRRQQQSRPSQVDVGSMLQRRHLDPSSNTCVTTRAETHLGVPSHLVSDLIDTFFTHAYNADLLLHKESFLRDQRDGRVRQHVLLSLCAFAAIFHRDSNGHTSLKEHGFATEWAESGARLVLQEVEKPTEDNIVSFLILALFWYSQGNWRRSYIHKGNAIHTAHILRLNNSRSDDHNPLKAELSRRRFWACFLMKCHSLESMSAIDTPAMITSLPLPWDESDFAVGTSAHPPMLLNTQSNDNGIYSTLVRAMSYWSMTHQLVKSPNVDSGTRLSEIYHLDSEICKWWSELPNKLRLDTANLSQTPRNDLPRLILLHSVYYQCLCAMHSSIVPLYSWGKQEQVPARALQLSAQIAYDNACTLSELFRSILEQLPDTSDLASFVGYAAYCGCAIQIPFMGCSNIAVRERATTNVQANLQIIHSIGVNWKFVLILASYAEHIMDAHRKHPLHLTNEPRLLPLNKLNGFPIVASKARASILEHNTVLWREDSVSVQGEEITDLGLGNEQVEAWGQSVSLNDSGIPEGPSEDVDRITHSTHGAISPVDWQSIPRPWDDLPEEFFHPILDATDLFDMLLE